MIDTSHYMHSGRRSAAPARSDRGQTCRIPEWHRYRIADPFSQFHLERNCRWVGLKVVCVWKPLEPSCFARCEHASPGWVNVATPPWGHESSSDGRGRLVRMQTPVDSHICGSLLMTLWSFGQAQIVRVVVEQPVDSSKVLFAEIGLSFHEMLTTQVFQPRERPKN